MQCIFCKRSTTDERSVEHILPESMGNAEHVLPMGAVCHSCNQYFCRKIERPLLESTLFRHLRSGMGVPSKRGRIPEWNPTDGIEVPAQRLMARFLGKVGLEVLAFKTKSVEGWNNEIVAKEELDELRNFVRSNQGADWPFMARTLYPVNAVFHAEEDAYHLWHEFDILLTERSEAYSVLSLFGVELVMNLGGRTMEGYEKWLESNKHASPLYAGINA